MNSKQIDNAVSGDVIWDDQVRGLHLKAFPTKKSFYLYYRTRDRQQRRPKLGYYGVLTLAAARDIAKEKLAIVAAGKDPFARGPVPRTMRDLYDEYLQTHAPKQEPSTRREYSRLWENHILPAMARKNINDVTEQDCRALHSSLDKTPVQANRVMSILRAGFNLAEDWGWKPRHSNPVYVSFNTEEARQRYPNIDEAPRLLKAMDSEEKKSPIFIKYVWMLALTAGRPGEIQKAQWDWITPLGIELPKAKRKKKGRLIALPKIARDMLKNIPRIKGNPHIFPGHKEGHYFVNIQQAWDSLLRVAKIEGLQLRDLRRYFASLALSGGAILDQVGQVLGHTQHQTTLRYTYLMQAARQGVVEGVAGQLMKIRHQKTPKGKQ